MRRVDRYILAEISGPLALGFLVFTFIFLINFLFKSAELIIRAQVPAGLVGRLLLLSLPSIVVLTIPMALLFSILIAIGRLSSDSELTALRSCGISLFSLFRPILALSTALAGVCAYLMLTVLPEGNHALQQLQVKILTQSLARQVEPRVPYTEWPGKVLYVFAVPPTGGRWQGVFLADSIPASTESTIVLAESGEALGQDDGSRVLISLKNALTHHVDLSNPARYDIGVKDLSQFLIDTQGSPQAVATTVKRGLRELSFTDLKAQVDDPQNDSMTRNLARVEIHKKFSIPAACMVFGLLALPLGFTHARGGKSAGFALSFAIILIYYILLSWGEELARGGTLPAWFSIWMSNVIFLGLGLMLLFRRNRDKPTLLNSLGAWFRLRPQPAHKRTRPRVARELRAMASTQRKPNKADLVLRLPEINLRLLNTIDRYILATYLRVFGIAILAGLTIYLVADLTERLDEIIEFQVPQQVVLDYYKFKCFTILYQIAPIISLVTTLVAFGLLSRTNEITAFKSSGISLYRLAVPVILVSLGIACVSGWLQAEVLPAANSRVAELEAVIMNRKTAHLQRADRRWLYGRGDDGASHYLYNYLSFDDRKNELFRLQVFKFDAEFHLTDRLLANHATYAGDGWWTFADGWSRSFAGNRHTSYRRFPESVRDRLPETPAFFQGELRQPTEMTYRELRQYVQELREIGGQEQLPQLEVALHNKIAYPAISLVMALVALPFAFRLERKGALYGIGLSLVLGIVLMGLVALFNALGQVTILPPVVAVWSPSILFAIFSLYLFLGVRT